MLAKQKDNLDTAASKEAHSVEWEELRKVPNEPLYKTVLDTSTRFNCQVLFLTIAILALLVTIGSGVSASRGYALVEVQRQAEQLEQENERLKIDIAKLKSPERIKTIAKDKLGMEVPKRTYFNKENK